MRQRHRRWLRPATQGTFVLLALSVVSMVATASVGASAQSDTESTPNQHTTVRALDRCSGEFATFDVTFHTLVHETTDGAGGTHSVLHIYGQRVTGVSDSGVIYTAAKSAFTTIEHELAGGTEVFTDTFVFHLITKGSEDNRVGEFTLHTTVNPDGTLTSSVDNFHIDCRG
jgi:hypothetical protein